RARDVPIDGQRLNVPLFLIVQSERRYRLCSEIGLGKIADPHSWRVGAENTTELARGPREPLQKLDVRRPLHERVAVFLVRRGLIAKIVGCGLDMMRVKNRV